MDIANVKETFYKRYAVSGNYLHYTFNGLHCTLMGYAAFVGAPFLSCPLSMGIGMFARKLGGSTVKIQGADSDRHFIYNYSTPSVLFKGKEKKIASLLTEIRKHGAGGAEILYKSSVPDFIPQDMEFNLTLTQSVFKTAGIEKTPLETASVAAHDAHIAPYSAAAYAKNGYCTFFNNDTPNHFPLPMTGYKVISVYCRGRDKNRSDRIYAALEKIRKKDKSVLSVADLAPIHTAALRDKTAAGYIRHLAEENIRINAALRGLKKCDIKALFRAMNASQSSMEKYWRLKKEYAFLAKCARNTEGVMAVRCNESGAVIIAENDTVDYVVNMIKLDFEKNAGYSPVFCVSETI